MDSAEALAAGKKAAAIAAVDDHVKVGLISVPECILRLRTLPLLMPILCNY